MYCRVINNEIKQGPMHLPSFWKDNRSLMEYDLDSMSDAELKELGWLPLIESTVNPKEPYETISSHEFIVNENDVTEVVTLNSLDIQQVIKQKIRFIDQFTKNKLETDCPFMNQMWQANSESRQNILGVTTAIANGIPLPTDFVWHTADGTTVPMNAQSMLGLGATIIQRVNTIYGVEYYHIGNVQQMTDPYQVIEYDYSAGWPQ